MTIDELRILRGLSMTKLCEAAGLSMGAVFKLTRPGAELERAQLGTVMKLAAGLGADKVSAAIISIARDGRVDPGEDVKMGEILAYMKNVASTAEAMQLWIKKNLKGEVYNGKK